MEAGISKSLQENIENLKAIFKDCDDIVYRIIDIGRDRKKEACLVFFDGLVDRSLISEYAIQLLMTEGDSIEGKVFTKSQELNELSKIAIAIPGVDEEDRLNEVVSYILSGETALFLDRTNKALILSTRGWPSRGVEEPETETLVRGPRDGFGETLKQNVTLVRRRIRDPKLKIKNFRIGRRSKTDISLMYMEDIVSKEILEEVKSRLNKIDIDAILDSSILEFLMEDNYLSPFPQIENTERPDTMAASLYEGRVGILVDNTPFALIVPATIGSLFQSAEDHYGRWTISTVIRWIRVIAATLSLLAPSLYIAISSFHPGLIPTILTYYLGASRVNVPFPAVIEAFLMELTIELLRESGTRMAGPIGTTIGIVGGIIIGEAAVEAGIVSPLMIIIVAVTTISSFSLPSYEWASGFRFCRFIFMGLAGVLGLYGIMLGLIVLMTHIAKLESFGVPFSAPYSGLGLEADDWKDTVIKAPVQSLYLRPVFTFPRNRRRMGRR